MLLFLFLTLSSYSQLYRFGDIKFNFISRDSILTYNNTFNFDRTWNIGLVEVFEIEELIRVNFDYQKAKGRFGKDRKLVDYDRQYLGIIDPNNNKIIKINCFLFNRELPDSEFPTTFYQVFDGGDIYFQLEINYTNRKCSEFKINGHEK